MEIKKISPEQADRMLGIINWLKHEDRKIIKDDWRINGFIEKTKLEDCIDRLKNIKGHLYTEPKYVEEIKTLIEDLESIADDMK